MTISYANGMRRTAFCVAVVVLSPAAALAHIALDTPNGGEQLVVGSTYTVEWHPIVEHDTLNWDLWYSTESAAGPWEVIALDLPLGDPTAGSLHDYDWLVPNLADSDVWLQVSQDNDLTRDYFDQSDESFSVLSAADFDGSGGVGASDLVIWEEGFGISSGAQHSQGDADLDGDVDLVDFEIWGQQVSSPVRDGLTSIATPEPATWLLVVLGGPLAVCTRQL